MEGPAPAERPLVLPVEDDEPEARSPIRVTPLGMFGAAFMFLLAAATAVALAQFWSGNTAPLLSIGYSLGAVICTLVAVLIGPPRRDR